MRIYSALSATAKGLRGEKWGGVEGMGAVTKPSAPLNISLQSVYDVKALQPLDILPVIVHRLKALK
jgi:hypothetical protein